MTEQERELAMKVGMAWDKAGPELERIRRTEIRETDTFESLKTFLGPIDFSKEPFSPRPSSGLLEQQDYFAKARP